jgi:hypothetical protein
VQEFPGAQQAAWQNIFLFRHLSGVVLTAIYVRTQHFVEFFYKPHLAVHRDIAALTASA